MWVEGKLQSQAAAQHGLLSRSQLLALGATDNEIGWRLKSGRIEPLHPGVYYLNATPATWKTDVLGGVMAAGPEAVASHRCAGVLWGLDAVHGRLIELTVPYEDSPVPGGVVLHRTRRPCRTAVVEGIPVTSVERTVLDLTRLLPQPVLVKAARSAVRDGITTVNRLDAEIGVSGGRGVKGTGTMRRVVAIIAYDKSGSVAEIDLGCLIADSPVPPPVQQLRIRLPNGDNVYPDYAWPDRRRLIEVDGFDTHGDPVVFQEDLDRQNQLMSIDWDMRRFSAALIRQDPERVKRELTEFINKPF